MSVYLQNSNQNWNYDVKCQPNTSSEANSLTSKRDVNTSSDVAVNVSKDLVAAAGFNVEAPIVNAIIGNITGTLPTKKSEVNESVRCEVCDCDITSNVTLAYHINGSKHKKKLKALNIIAQLKEEKGVHAENSDNPNAFRCEICCLTVNSAQQLEFHLSGSKHKKKIGKDISSELNVKSSCDNAGLVTNPPSPKKKKKEEFQMLTCDLCGVFMNSPLQYEQHYASKKHKSRTSQVNVHKKDWTGPKQYDNYFKSGGSSIVPSNIENYSKTINYNTSTFYNSHHEKKKSFFNSNYSAINNAFKNPYFNNKRYNSGAPSLISQNNFQNFTAKNFQ